MVSVLNRVIYSSQNFPFEYIHHFLNVQHSVLYNTIARTNVLYNNIFVFLDIKLDLKCFWKLK
jgi:hypothetical protein